MTMANSTHDYFGVYNFFLPKISKNGILLEFLFIPSVSQTVPSQNRSPSWYGTPGQAWPSSPRCWPPPQPSTPSAIA